MLEELKLSTRKSWGEVTCSPSTFPHLLRLHLYLHFRVKFHNVLPSDLNFFPHQGPIVKIETLERLTLSHGLGTRLSPHEACEGSDLHRNWVNCLGPRGKPNK